MADDLLHRPPITRRELVADLRRLGVESGSVLMVHCSLSSLGYVVGGADSVVIALREVVGSEGTVLAMTGWEHDSSSLEEWPEPVQAAYRRDPPIFDPKASEAARDNGRLAERIRTWPGARQSFHPVTRFSAIGPHAQWLTEDQPWGHSYGPGSPLAKVVESEGSVLMLGAPLSTITLLHYAEELADVPNKTHVSYVVPTQSPEGIEWREVHDIDTSKGAFPYEDVVGNRDSFQVIGEEALGSGVGRRGRVGASTSHLFGAKELVSFAVQWIETHFK